MNGISRAVCILVVSFITIFAAISASAYEINPLKNRYRPGGGRVFSFVADTVHEDITQMALGCAERHLQVSVAAQGVLCPITERLPQGPDANFGSALIRGVWWNDDPDQLLYSVHYATWAVRMRHAESLARADQLHPDRPPTINASYRMQYRSHYGDLQFLHAMANADGEPAQDVQQRIMQWAEFAYAVAIGDIDAETTLGEIDLPAIRNYFESRPGWSVGYLFRPRYLLTNRPVGEVALGSILHMIQDSYSTPHAKRAYDEVGEGCPNGRVVQFYSYANQDSNLHHPHDSRASFDSNRHFTPSQNPVEASAQLILFARRRADWASEVAPYLRDRLFCIGADSERSSAGEFARRPESQTKVG